jgi:hypothetical protein
LGGRFINASGASRREDERVSGYFVIASEAKQSTLSFLLRHGLLRRSLLAMTVSKLYLGKMEWTTKRTRHART